MYNANKRVGNASSFILERSEVIKYAGKMCQTLSCFRNDRRRFFGLSKQKKLVANTGTIK